MKLGIRIRLFIRVNNINIDDSEQIAIQNTTLLLGLHTDGHLNWNEHVHKVLSKANSGIYAKFKISF